MKSSFKNSHAYKISKKFFQLVSFCIKNYELKKQPELETQIIKLSLSLVSNIAKSHALKSKEEKEKCISASLQTINKLSALFDLALDLKLLQKKDVNTIEMYLQELTEALEKESEESP